MVKTLKTWTNKIHVLLPQLPGTPNGDGARASTNQDGDDPNSYFWDANYHHVRQKFCQAISETPGAVGRADQPILRLTCINNPPGDGLLSLVDINESLITEPYM